MHAVYNLFIYFKGICCCRHKIRQFTFVMYSLGLIGLNKRTKFAWQISSSVLFVIFVVSCLLLMHIFNKDNIVSVTYLFTALHFLNANVLNNHIPQGKAQVSEIFLRSHQSI